MPEESNPQQTPNNQQGQDQSQQNNQQSQQSNDNSHLFGFFERVLDTVLSRKPVDSSQSSETIDSTGNGGQTQDDSKQQDVINQLQSQIEELKKQIPQSSESTGDDGTDVSTSSQESSESTGDDGTDNDNGNQTAQFPDSKPENGRRKSKRDRYLEIAQKSPRKAAKYFQEHGSDILSGVRFFE